MSAFAAIADALKAAWGWVRTHAPVVLAIVVGVVGFVVGGLFFKGLRHPDVRIRRELDAAREGELAARIALDHGTDHAVQVLEEQHTETIATLDAAQRKKYEALREDPRALAAHLSRLSDLR